MPFMPRTDKPSRTQEGQNQLRATYHFIIGYCLEHGGLPPTPQEIQDACRLASTSVADCCVQLLIDQGLLTAQGTGKARRIRIVGAQWKAPSICPQCSIPHCWGTVHNQWWDIVEECINE